MTEERIQSFSQSKLISTDVDTMGFDLSSGDKWIYPENFPRREYQFSIVQTALYSNTLVCLPTGLGKTFIAAVIMYNFWRWYPKGRIVFLAPTKPLVTQQIFACNDIMGIPHDETIELTGTVNRNKRQQAWKQKRVIFATPQTFQKDLQNDYVPQELIKCVVIDEAHKALGKHSYCEIIRALNKKTKFFRVLALSATPGSKIDHVRQVVQNLNISELELRDDSSPDIIPYINDRSIEKVIVRLNKQLKTYKERYINIMDRHVRILVNCKILQGNLNNISKGKIFMLLKQYENPPKKSSNHGIILKTLNILITMYHAFELLIKHGLRAFYNFYSNHSDKFWLKAEIELQVLLEDIIKHIGNLPPVEALIDGNISNIPDNIIFGHDKFYKLCDLLVEHFKSFSEQKQSTRAIVFVEYRDIVNEAYVLLLQKKPLIRPQMFIGRAGFNQKQQSAALEDFRNNKVNVLISTSVGEEGLDVGEVDLIVCFDISSSTPIRLVQRMGRTGRKRKGRVVVLLTEGQEEVTFSQALTKKNSLNTKILQSSNITSSLYESNSRMVPAYINPQCLPIFIKVQPKQHITSKKVKQSIEKKSKKYKNNSIPLYDNDIASSSSSSSKTNLNTKSYTNTQSTMMKFLSDQRQEKPLSTRNYESDSGILSEELHVIQNKTNIENSYTVIKPEEVKLITSDSHSVEFLTLCTMKKSEHVTQTHNIINIDKAWVPTRSSHDIFHDFHVPTLDTLNCIEGLTFYNKSFENELTSVTIKSLPNFNTNEQNMRSDIKFNEFEDSLFNECVHAKIDQKTNLNIQEKIGIDEFDLLNSDCSTTKLNKIETLEKTKSISKSVEIFTSDFFEDDCFTFNSKNYLPENDLKKDSKDQDKINSFTTTCEAAKEYQYLSQEPIESATVEVDFQNILDECTESEESESQTLINSQFEQANIFDELLNGTSSDTDIFNFSEDDDNINNIPTVINKNTIKNSSKSTIKRSASSSPCRESIKKKQKISDIDSSDSESTDIPGTPQKSKEIKLNFDNDNNIEKLIVNNDYLDSDQDLFDDLDFDTQFSFTSINGKVPSENETNHIIIQSGEKDKKSINAEYNQGLFDENLKKSSVIKKEENVHLIREKIKDENKEIKKDFNKDSELLLREMSLFDKKIALNDIEKEDKNKNKRLFNDRKDNLFASKKPSIMDLSDLNLSDWNDDFNLVKKESSFSNIFQVNTTKEIKNVQLKVAYNRNFSSTSNETFDFPVNSNLKRLTSKSLSDNKKLNSLNLDDKNEIFNVQNIKSSKLNLLSLKKNVNDNVNKDEDCFIIPQDEINANCELKMSEFTALNVIEHKYNNKENKLPSASDHYKKENGISPQFQNNIVENNMQNNNKHKTKAKKLRNVFIDNEAVVSTSDESLDESSGDEDKDLTDFISYSQEQIDTTDMRAHYLQTLNKSPIKAGGFVFKPLKNVAPDCEIYSQVPSQADNSYVNDSFCVGDETYFDDYSSDKIANNSVLEDIEIHLENERKKAKKKRRLKLKGLNNSRKQICSKKLLINNRDSDSSSSEDETEALRNEVMEESLLLKQFKK
ncbi:PREDICTED: Fanconi anemia group M protein [Ceratosolen solmsi marchali]|uniref:Fanconi anemia group M protein n=1 Tax=Ceratosolen solmsi marchali TaxID=326594 RepID=A0AAJ6YQA7_9HYME|nr:PREDICTED: Fanconi anemia group M protein [Ceratosolen solmsi marchali]